MIQGTEIELGGVKYTVAPMNFATLIKVTPLLKSFAALGNKQPNEEDFKNIVTIMQLAINRNHPEVTFDMVAESLDMVNMSEIMAKIMSTAGTVNKGEAQAGNP